MKLWLGEALTYELIQHWHECSTFPFGNDIHMMFLFEKDLWGSLIRPHRFIRAVSFVAMPPRSAMVSLTRDNSHVGISEFGCYLRLIERQLLLLKEEASITMVLTTGGSLSKVKFDKCRLLAAELYSTI